MRFAVTPREVVGNVRAGHLELRDRNLPTVEGWKDLLHTPGLVRSLLQRRLADGVSPGLVQCFPVPKPGKTEVRLLASLHPLDELWYRILGGRIAAHVQRMIDPSEVLSYRLAEQPPEWRVEDVNRAFTLRQTLALQFLSDPHCKAMGTLDIRKYYPSIKAEVVSSSLAQAGVAPREIRAFEDFLVSLEGMGAPPGLPVDLATSGILGRLLLQPGDGLMRRSSLGFLRFSDDIWAFVSDSSEWQAILDEYERVISSLGLGLNSEKTAMYSKAHDDPVAFVRHSVIYGMTMGGRSRVSENEACEALAEQAKLEQPDYSLVRFALGVLRSNRCPDGLAILMEHPHLLHSVPRNIGLYLYSIARSSRQNKLIDRDWLVEIASDIPSALSCAMQVQSLRTLSNCSVSKAHGETLSEIAMGTKQRRNPPILAWAAFAWGNSEAFRPSEAVEMALSTGHFDVRRALVLGLHNCGWHPRKLQQACDRLWAVDQNLGPALSYISS